MPSMPLDKDVQEVRDTLTAMAVEPSGRFLEVRGNLGLEYRVKLEHLLTLIRALEEETMWMALSRDKALEEACEALEAAKEHSKVSGLEVTKSKQQLKRITACLAALDPSFVKADGDVDFSAIFSRINR